MYAEGTTVPVNQSRSEIFGILAKHGVMVMAQGTTPTEDTIQFELSGKVFRLTITKPTNEDIFRLYPNHRDTQAKLDQEWRRRWRAHVLLLKAKLEFADGDTSTVERELMPYMLLKDGRTLEQAVGSDDAIRLLAAGS